MNVLHFKRIDKGFVVGKFDLVLHDFGGLQIRDCTLFCKNGHHWISYPYRTYTDTEGKTKYFNYIKFDEKMQKKIEDNVIKILGAELNEPKNTLKSVEPPKNVPSQPEFSGLIPF